MTAAEHIAHLQRFGLFLLEEDDRGVRSPNDNEWVAQKVGEFLAQEIEGNRLLFNATDPYERRSMM